ncbi:MULTISPECIES: hypothetical protein [unclassified Bradyrhizobium]|uniref:hypothetical protein n=1 Tax=unclassified Bradyrhizobium TaxID=2631580 RepID=UPI002915CEA3|nr:MULTISPECIES: hypothetical protein [unclassified Bradyrhizobium]
MGRYRSAHARCLISGHRALMFPPETITLPGACVGLFFAFGGSEFAAHPAALEKKKPPSGFRNEGFEQR